jgi:nitrate/nitrite-specific signal transduction histidine kinase
VTVFGSYRFIPELQAALLAEVEESQALVAYRQAQWVGILIAVISALAATAVGFFTSGSISRPVRDLTVSAQRIGSGELKAQVGELRRTDEIGVLANAFQKMQSELVASYEKLEQRVAARTKDLATVARISTAVATIQDPFEMLANTVHLTQRGFNLYHAHVFVYRKDTDDLQIVACGYKEGDEHEGTHGTAIIPVSQEQSLVARAARTQRPELAA